MSKKVQKNARNVIESDSEDDEESFIESSFDESNNTNATLESSRPNDDLEIAETDEELEKSSFVEENSNVEQTDESHEAGSAERNDQSAQSNDVSQMEESSNNLDESERSRNESSRVANESNASGVESEGYSNTSNNDSDDSDDEVVVQYRRSHVYKNRIVDSSDDDDEEEEKVVERRKTLYIEHPEGDDDAIEDQVFSRATRRSIFGAPAIKQEAVSLDKIESDASDSDSDIIISDSEDEKENFNRRHTSQLSSTLRSPLREENSMSSPEQSSGRINVKKEPLNVSEPKLVRVPRFVYEEEIRARDSLENKIKLAESNKSLHAKLPDKGAKLLARVADMKVTLEEKNAEIKKMVIDEQESITNKIKRSINEESSIMSEDDPSYKEVSSDAAASRPTNYLVAEDVQPKHFGKTGMKNFLNQKAMTVEALQDIHQSLDERPGDDVVAEPPKHLKVELMKHQLHAIAFMMWRESQKPRGGLLADDMGLGKTLTAIALVMKKLQIYEEQDEEDEDSEDEGRNEWIAQGRKDLRDGGTLIVCPASLMNQWEHEIKNKVRRGALNVCVFHGAKRPARSRELAKYDVVITTYQIVVSEHKNEGCLFDLRWDRIILDEGHVIRNHRSKQNEAVCGLEGKHRWVLTGTPVHNKEFDMYAAIKFLRCRPFDDVNYWRMWIEGKKGTHSPRLQTLLKSILLRRTKQQLMESGDVKTLPNKIFEEVKVQLNPEERKVYMRITAYSKAVFARFLMQQQDKYNNFTYDQTQVHRLHSKLAKAYNVDREVQASEILVLLLRMRQVCCHAGLIKHALEQFGAENEQVEGINDSNHESDGALLRQLQDLKITNDTGIDGQVAAVDEAVYDMNIPGSKLEKLIESLKDKIEEGDDKIIIVSQWVSFLDIIRGMLEVEGIQYCELTGRIPVKKRNDIVVEFNRKESNLRVMLLSITAGGVGLNLVGANQLFILDPHWNPQIEQQAQDRIYRFGQEKNVKIIKFISENTIEEDIVKIQKTKLELATNTLTGAKSNATKLTLDDLKTLFGMGPQQI